MTRVHLVPGQPSNHSQGNQTWRDRKAGERRGTTVDSSQALCRVVNDNPLNFVAVAAACEGEMPWHDSGGTEYDCAWYAGSRQSWECGKGFNQTCCERYGNTSANFDMTANEACVVCGGGVEDTECVYGRFRLSWLCPLSVPHHPHSPPTSPSLPTTDGGAALLDCAQGTACVLFCLLHCLFAENILLCVCMHCHSVEQLLQCPVVNETEMQRRAADGDTDAQLCVDADCPLSNQSSIHNRTGCIVVRGEAQPWGHDRSNGSDLVLKGNLIGNVVEDGAVAVCVDPRGMAS